MPPDATKCTAVSSAAHVCWTRYLMGTLSADRCSKAATETRTSYHLNGNCQNKLIGSGRAWRGNAPRPCRARPRSPRTFRKWQFPSKETLTALQALLSQQQEPSTVAAWKSQANFWQNMYCRHLVVWDSRLRDHRASEPIIFSSRF